MRFAVVLMFALALAGAVLTVSACGPVQADCGPHNCDGCCSLDGRCQLGQAEGACGAGGGACVSCPATQSCVGGACVPFVAGDAGCAGCRDALGVCHGGQTEAGCGIVGGVCVSCADGERCQNGRCVPDTGCKPEGERCQLSGDCCSDFCSADGVCLTRPQGRDAGSTCPSMNVCADQPGPGDASCACAQAVCAVDPFCCSDQWDLGCAQMAQRLCPECGGGTDGGLRPDGGLCEPEGALCSQDQECCQGVCSAVLGLCWAGLGGDGGTCLPDFDPCTQHGDCCNGFCNPQSGLCWAGGSDGGPGCFMDFTPCSQHADCCGNFCEPQFGLCWSGGGFDGGGLDGGSGNAVQCGALGMACTSGDDCCSATCVDGACVPNPNGGQVACGAITDLCRNSATGTDPASPRTCDPCVEAICAGDPWCCQNDWDGVCVQAAAQACGRCPNAPPLP